MGDANSIANISFLAAKCLRENCRVKVEAISQAIEIFFSFIFLKKVEEENLKRLSAL